MDDGSLLVLCWLIAVEAAWAGTVAHLLRLRRWVGIVRTLTAAGTNGGLLRAARGRRRSEVYRTLIKGLLLALAFGRLLEAHQRPPPVADWADWVSLTCVLLLLFVLSVWTLHLAWGERAT